MYVNEIMLKSFSKKKRYLSAEQIAHTHSASAARLANHSSWAPLTLVLNTIQ